MGYKTQAQALDLLVLASLVPVFLIVLVHLLGIHWADRKADEAVGKRSLVLIAGARTISIHRALTALAYLRIIRPVGSILPGPVLAAFALTLPFSLRAIAAIGKQDSPSPSALTMAASLAILGAGWILSA